MGYAHLYCAAARQYSDLLYPQRLQESFLKPFERMLRELPHMGEGQAFKYAQSLVSDLHTPSDLTLSTDLA